MADIAPIFGLLAANLPRIENGGALLLALRGRWPLHSAMKLLSLTALAFAVCLSFLSATPTQAKDKNKITKNEAEHIALKRQHGARVTAAKLETVEGKLVWSIEITRPKTKRATHVTVDAMSGRILTAKKAAR